MQLETIQMSVFADTIMKQKYSHELTGSIAEKMEVPDGTKEEWPSIAYRVTKNVLKPLGYTMRDKVSQDICKMITERKFLPAGRYLYASGRPYSQVQNCYSAETEVITSLGTFTIQELSETNAGKHTIMTSQGRWVEADFRCFGVQTLMEVELGFGRGGKTLYATAEHSWRVAESFGIDQSRGGRRRFTQKHKVLTQDLTPGDTLWQTFGYGMSRTPINPVGIQHGFVWGDGNISTKGHQCTVRLCGDKQEYMDEYFALFPNHVIEDDIELSLLPSHFKSLVPLQYDRSYLLGWLVGYFAADGCVADNGRMTLLSHDISSVQHVKDVCAILGIGCNQILTGTKTSNLDGKEYTHYSVSFDRSTVTKDFFLNPEHQDRWLENPPQKQTFWKVKSVKRTDRVEPVYCAIVPDTHEFVLADNILTGNCLLLRCHDSREGWSELLHNASMALMTGAGIGVDYSDLRSEGATIRGTGGKATGPIALMQMLNECGRGIMQGGARRSAIWAGLRWDHPDIHKFIRIKNWSDDVKAMKAKDFNFPAPLDCTNISVQLNDEFFEAFHDNEHVKHSLAQSVYWAVIEQALETAEPGFSVDTGKNSGETLRNACTEISSKDDSDICNLGSINLARIDDIEEFEKVVDLGTLFLLAGTVYSDVPYEKVDRVRTKNRRLGLGLMGVHEWLIKRGKPYAPDEDLEKWLKKYKKSGKIANKYADQFGLSRPKKTRSIAPTGTISIIAETTGGLEPLFCIAYKRRYLKHNNWCYQYVIDPTAKRLIDAGADPHSIEDAYTLAEDVERRVKFQHWIQQFVDHGISSTVNLPAWGTKLNNKSKVQPFGTMLMKYLPELRGITCYPDGCRSGQPFTPCDYEEALRHEGAELVEEAVQACSLAKGGDCGD